MYRHLDNEPAPGTVDDAHLGELVRAVADDWRVPPQRLGQAGWRERLSGPRPDRRGSGGRGWFGRLAGATTLALVATVVLAITAVYLNGPGRDRGIGTSPSARPTDERSPSPRASATPPVVVLNGAPPSVTDVLLEGSGGFRYADLLTATLAPNLPFASGEATALFPRLDGGWVCVCTAYSGFGSGSPARIDITLKAVDGAGRDLGVSDVRTVQSEDSTNGESMQVDVRATVSADGRSAYVGWSHRTTAGWRAGLEQVDLTTLRIIDSVALSDVDHGDAAAGGAWTRLAPQVSQRLDGNTMLISSDWFVEDPGTATPPFGTDRWEGYYTPLVIPETADSCSGWSGLIDDASFYVACIDNAGSVHVTRLRLDGTVIDSSDIGRWTGYGVNNDRLGSKLFLWDAQAARLVRFDLETGMSDSVVAATTGATVGPAGAVAELGRAVGDWLAPRAMAKVLLEPAMAISPDGTTLYALGIDGAIESLGSTGIYVFDIGGDALTVKDHWEATADFISVAVSTDGAFVYAAGMAGVDPRGNLDAGIRPSVTVFDASDGSVRLVTQLSGYELLFVEPILR